MSVFEHIQQAMEQYGFSALVYAWLGTALIISWCYAIPIGISVLIKKVKGGIETEKTEKEITEIQKRLFLKEKK